MFRHSLSSRDGSKSCRICLDSNNPSDLISPCLCRGGSAYVHRKCLDNWRALNENGRGFNYCEVCHFEYIIEPVVDDPSADWRRLWIFRLLITRDIMAIVLLIQAFIIGLAFLTQAADKRDHAIRDLYPDGMSSFGVYYLSSLILFLAILGLFGLIGYCCAMGSRNSSSTRSDTTCLYCFCINTNSSNCNGGGNCDCNGCGGGGGGGGEGAVVVLLVIVVLFAIIGIFVGIFLGGIIVKDIVARHKKKLWLRQEAKKYVVKDLEGRAGEYVNRTARRPLVGSSTPQTTTYESNLPQPSAPVELLPVKTHNLS